MQKSKRYLQFKIKAKKKGKDKFLDKTKIMRNSLEKSIFKKPVLIGLAGQSCAGKNIAADFLKEQGFFCIDADKISRKIFKENQAEILKIFKPIAKKKGFSICYSSTKKPNKNKESTLLIDKKQFAMLLFSDSGLLKQHENFILPKIEAQIKTEIEEAFLKEPSRAIILNAPTLHKTKFVKICKFILYIKSPYLFRIFRAKRRDKLPIKNIVARFSQQKDFFSQYLYLNADTVVVKNFIFLSKFKDRILAVIKQKALI